MPVEVTIKNLGNNTKRIYKGNFALGFIMDDVGSGRWVQEPQNNNEGLSMFVAALSALREVAAIRGDELFKVAARDALEAMDKARNAKVIKPAMVSEAEKAAKDAKKQSRKASEPKEVVEKTEDIPAIVTEVTPEIPVTQDKTEEPK